MAIVISLNSPIKPSSASFISKSTLKPTLRRHQFLKLPIHTSRIACKIDENPNPTLEDEADGAGVKLALSILRFYKSESLILSSSISSPISQLPPDFDRNNQGFDFELWLDNQGRFRHCCLGAADMCQRAASTPWLLTRSMDLSKAVPSLPAAFAVAILLVKDWTFLGEIKW